MVGEFVMQMNLMQLKLKAIDAIESGSKMSKVEVTPSQGQKVSRRPIAKKSHVSV